MELTTISVIICFIGAVLILFAVLKGSDWMMVIGQTLGFLGALGVIFFSANCVNIEEQKPCRCENCCCVKTERYE